MTTFLKHGVVTREAMAYIMLRIGVASDLTKPLTVAKRTELLHRWTRGDVFGDVAAMAPSKLDPWLDDAVAAGVLMAQ